MTNPYTVDEVLKCLVRTHLMRQVVAHISYRLSLRSLLGLHNVSDGVQVVGCLLYTSDAADE